MRILVSRTTRTRGVHLLVNQVKDFLLAISGIAVLDLADSEIQQTAAHGVIDES